MGNCQQNTTQKSKILGTSVKNSSQNIFIQGQLPEGDIQISDYLKKVGKQNESVYRHLKNSLYYIGKMNEKNEPDGEGILYNAQVTIYKGSFCQMNPEGEGSIKFINTNYHFTGQIKNGNAHGKGKLENQVKGFVIEGIWQDSKPKSGHILFKDGIKAQSNDFYGNKVKIIYPGEDQKIYEGEVAINTLTPEGKGKLTYKNKSYYQGTWKDGCFQGQGIFCWYLQQGNTDLFQIYQGQFKNGKKEGKGKCVFVNKNYYLGNWHQGKMHGQGCIMNPLGNIKKKGIWNQGIFYQNPQKQIK